MAIIDDRSEIADALALSTGSTGRQLVGDVIDLRAGGLAIDPNAARAAGIGDGSYFNVQVDTAFTSGGAATVSFELVSDAQSAIATDGSATVHAATGAHPEGVTRAWVRRAVHRGSAQPSTGALSGSDRKRGHRCIDGRQGQLLVVRAALRAGPGVRGQRGMSGTPEPNLLGDSAQGERPSTFGAGGMYSASNMVDDIPRDATAKSAPASAPTTPAASVDKPGPAPASPPAAPPAAQGLDALRHAPHAEPVMPYGPEVRNEAVQAAESSGMSAEQAAQVGEAWTAIFHAHGVTPNEATHLVDAGLAVSRGLPDADTEAGWIDEATERLRGEYGPDGSTHALELARRYVKAHPQLDAYLTKTRLGNHPRVVLAVTGAAHRAFKAGRFK